MRADIHIGIVDLIIFLGIFQGVLLAFFFLRNAGGGKAANRYQGFFLGALSLVILEELLNNTGYMVHLLHLANFSEPLNLAFGPLLYLYIKRSIHPRGKSRKELLHFLPFMIYLAYMGFYFVQPETFKYNSFIHSKHPGWQMLEVKSPLPADPLGIRNHINALTALVLIVYLALISHKLWIDQTLKKGPYPIAPQKLRELKSSTLHFIVLLIIFIGTKIYFVRDLGDYIVACYISLFFYLTTFRIMGASNYFHETHSFLEVPGVKYGKSSLNETRKQQIIAGIKQEMQKEGFYADHLASLSLLADKLRESKHHVSQVINEKMNKTFFELLAYYRVEAAKRMLTNNHRLLTIEQIAEEVGYNSKSAFNTAFKKFTGCTPSQYKKKNASSPR